MRMPALLLSLTLTGGLAVLTVVSAADASAARGGSTTVSDLTGFGAAGARMAAASALDSKDAARAACIARTTVLRAPIERGGTSLLGIARLSVGDTEGGLAAMRAALMLGWRDPLTQAWAMQVSIENGDMANAVLRLDALARLNPKLDNLSPPFETFERSKEGRTALLARMKLRPPWLESYLQSADRVTAVGASNRATMILAASQFAEYTDPVAASSAIWAMHRRDPVAAYRLWRSLSGDKAGSGTSQTSLPLIGAAISAQNKTPFDWRIADEGPLISPSSSGMGLLLENKRPVRQLALFINTALASDRQYRLILDGKGPNGAVIVDARCTNAADLGSLVKADTGKIMRLSVPAGCPSQIVTVSIGGGPVSYEIRTLSLEPQSSGS